MGGNQEGKFQGKGRKRQMGKRKKTGANEEEESERGSGESREKAMNATCVR